MITSEHLAQFHDQGYFVIQDAISPRQLAKAREACEQTIGRALRLGHALRDEQTGFIQGHYFQRPHHPELAVPALMQAIAAPSIIEFCQGLYGGDRGVPSLPHALGRSRSLARASA